MSHRYAHTQHHNHTVIPYTNPTYMLLPWPLCMPAWDVKADKTIKSLRVISMNVVHLRPPYFNMTITPYQGQSCPFAPTTCGAARFSSTRRSTAVGENHMLRGYRIPYPPTPALRTTSPGTSPPKKPLRQGVWRPSRPSDVCIPVYRTSTGIGSTVIVNCQFSTSY